ncbi:hypothetical protein M0R72_11910 [Candidatus Pacearchaeota archaeon]|jgi:hypothetical protein|nr:hypothetical protein [Candidatus Pacearchaeota archaeon]
MYTPTDWLELSMSTAQKLTALDNLEGMYGEAVSYIDAITHSSSYYTDAQAAARYFTSANDGTGSGLVAATLDGLTAQQIIDAGAPSGAIAIWSGAEADISTLCPGWVLCNGLNSTPDLRSRFVIGAGGAYAKDATGGADHLSLTEKTITVAGQALTATHLPSHRHPYTDYYRGSGGVGGIESIGGGSSDHAGFLTTAATSDTHTHSITFTGDDIDILPKYWALCFIQKT